MDLVYVGVALLFFAASWGMVRMIGAPPGGGSE